MLYGWIEVGASNNHLFLNESNEDVIVRTIYGTSKVIVGNTDGTNVPAGIYVHGNNVGVQKVPSSNIELDVLGTGRIHSMYIGYSNDYGLATINAPTIWKDITKHSSNLMELMVQNSNEHVDIKYNGVDRIQITDGHGLTLNDTIYVTEDVFANAFQVTSDRRLKDDITPTNQHEDVATLKDLRVYDYTMNRRHLKGFIAQDVEEVFPRSVVKKKGIIPMNVILKQSNGMLYVQDAHEMLEEGDEIIVKDLAQYPHTKRIYTVESIYSDGHFSLEGYTETDGEEICMVGKLVPDVCTVDMNQITALNTSVLHDVLSRLERLEKFVYENK